MQISIKDSIAITTRIFVSMTKAIFCEKIAAIFNAKREYNFLKCVKNYFFTAQHYLLQGHNRKHDRFSTNYNPEIIDYTEINKFAEEPE